MRCWVTRPSTTPSATTSPSPHPRVLMDTPRRTQPLAYAASDHWLHLLFETEWRCWSELALVPDSAQKTHHQRPGSRKPEQPSQIACDSSTSNRPSPQPAALLIYIYAPKKIYIHVRGALKSQHSHMLERAPLQRAGRPEDHSAPHLCR